MSEQDGKQVATLQCPTTDDPKAWKAYWETQGQPWRTEPEIDSERQKYLTERRANVPDIEQGIYPFKDIEPKLTRADIEWLLATHENGRGPVDWRDEKQRNRIGLDLRGAYMRGVDLSRLPVAGLSGGEYTRREGLPETYVLNQGAGMHLEEANLFEAHLEGSNLINAHLERANLDRAHLYAAFMFQVHLTNTALAPDLRSEPVP